MSYEIQDRAHKTSDAYEKKEGGQIALPVINVCDSFSLMVQRE